MTQVMFSKVCVGRGSHNKLELSVFKKSIIKRGGGVHNNMRGF